MAHTAKAARAELILSLGVLVFGLAAAVVAWRLPEGGGYARIGPNFMPKLVSGGLILLVCGIVDAREYARRRRIVRRCSE